MGEDFRKSVLSVSKPVIALLPFEVRFGSDYRKKRLLLKKAESWTKDEFRNWQYSKLRAIIHLAYESTTGYRELYSAHGVHPRDLRCVDDLKYFPVVNKEILSSNIESFTIKRRKSDYLQRTSGTSGRPFAFWSRYRDFTESAFIHYTWQKFGHDPNKLAAVLKGGFGSHDDRAIKFSRFDRSLYLSTPMLSRVTLGSYLKEIKRKRIKILRALPSSFNLLCDLLDGVDKDMWPVLDVVSLSSEMITDGHWEKFSHYFPRTTFFSWYGHSEHAVFAPRCINSKSYHPNNLYGVTEVLSEDLTQQKIGLNGNIVGTSFWSSPTLFIRYMTDDIAEVGDNQCRFCGHLGPTWNRIIGRSSAYFIGNRGTKVSATVMNLQDETYEGILEYQFFQDRPGKLTFIYVEKHNSKIIDVNDIRRKIESKLGPSFSLEICKVMSIKRPASGKLKTIDQRL